MAELICTKEEFHRYIGPRIRNVIQSITKKRKSELNHICQGCNNVKELEAAHIIGNSRKDVINTLIEKYFDEEKKLVKVDLAKFEKEIISAHKPLDNYFKFLCTQCHMDYDRKNKDRKA